MNSKEGLMVKKISTVVKSKRLQEGEQLSLWLDDKRGVPNTFVRSSLFSITNKKFDKDGRLFVFMNELLYATGGTEILYSGAQLDQTDLDIWQTLVHFSKQQDSNTVVFSAASFLKAIGKTRTGSNITLLIERMAFMQQTRIEIKDSQQSFSGQLINQVYRSDVTKQFTVALSPELKNLFQFGGYSIQLNAIRIATSRKPFAKWLYGYFCSHKNPYPIKIETIHKMCGSETKDMYSFKQHLCESLEYLKTTLSSINTHFSYEIINNKVYVTWEKMRIPIVSK